MSLVGTAQAVWFSCDLPDCTLPGYTFLAWVAASHSAMLRKAALTPGTTSADDVLATTEGVVHRLLNSSLVLFGDQVLCVCVLSPQENLSCELQWSDKVLLRKTPHSLVRRPVRLKLVLTIKLPPWWLGVYAGCPGRKANNSLIQMWTLKATMARSGKICVWVGVIVAQMIRGNQLLLIGSMAHSAGENSYLVL